MDKCRITKYQRAKDDGFHIDFDSNLVTFEIVVPVKLDLRPPRYIANGMLDEVIIQTREVLLSRLPSI